MNFTMKMENKGVLSPGKNSESSSETSGVRASTVLIPCGMQGDIRLVTKHGRDTFRLLCTDHYAGHVHRINDSPQGRGADKRPIHIMKAGLWSISAYNDTRGRFEKVMVKSYPSTEKAPTILLGATTRQSAEDKTCVVYEIRLDRRITKGISSGREVLSPLYHRGAGSNRDGQKAIRPLIGGSKMKKMVQILSLCVLFVLTMVSLSFAGMGGGMMGGMMQGGSMGMGQAGAGAMGDHGRGSGSMHTQDHMQMMDQMMQDPRMHEELMNRMMGDASTMNRMMGDQNFMNAMMDQMIRDPELMNRMMDQMMRSRGTRSLVMERMIQDPELRDRVLQGSIRNQKYGFKRRTGSEP